MSNQQTNYLDHKIEQKKQEILITKQRLLKLETELDHLKRQKTAVKGFREQLAEAFGK